MLLNDLQVVLQVARLKSIRQAALSLDMQTATASAAVKRVENTLGITLFIRSTRNLRLSAAGETHLPQLEQAMGLLEQVRQGAKAHDTELNDELRIAVPSDLGRNVIAGWLDALMAAHPGLKLKLHLSDSNIDFYRDPVDIAIRYGSPKDSSLYGFKLCNVPRVLCASNDYLARYGTPQTPAELSAHNALLYQLHDVVYNNWAFVTGEKVSVQGNRIANDADMVRRWCVAGFGAATKSALDMAGELLAGKVRALCLDTPPVPTELWLICPSRQIITPAVRALREHLREQCSELLDKLVTLNIRQTK